MQQHCHFYAEGNCNVSCTVSVKLGNATSSTQAPGSEAALSAPADLMFSTAF